MLKINKITPLSSPYLKVLADIPSRPDRIFFLGKLPESRVISVAIVGSRKPTAYGKEVTYKLAYDLASKGVVIVSGLAFGVDAIAHRAALDAGGATIAVMGNSVDITYPASNKTLASEIVKNGGAIISEYGPTTEPRSFRFLERNRIVSGLSDGIIITEAAARSGTLSTAAHALSQGKEVFVMPGIYY